MSKLVYSLLALFAVILTGACADTSDIGCEPDPSIESLPFEDCGSQFDVMSVTISSCTVAPCEIPINGQIELEIVIDDDPILHREFLEDTSEDIKHEAFWTLNEVETSADILSKNSIFCNKLPIMKTKLKIGEMVSNVRGTLHWKTFNKDGTVAVCVIIPIVLVKSTSSTDEVKIPKQSLTPTPTPMPTPTPTPMPTPKPTLIPKDSSSIEDRLNATQSKTAE